MSIQRLSGTSTMAHEAAHEITSAHSLPTSVTTSSTAGRTGPRTFVRAADDFGDRDPAKSTLGAPDRSLRQQKVDVLSEHVQRGVLRLHELGDARARSVQRGDLKTAAALQREINVLAARLESEQQAIEQMPVW
jgi:hypothetical protein